MNVCQLAKPQSGLKINSQTKIKRFLPHSLVSIKISTHSGGGGGGREDQVTGSHLEHSTRPCSIQRKSNSLKISFDTSVATTKR